MSGNEEIRAFTYVISMYTKHQPTRLMLTSNAAFMKANYLHYLQLQIETLKYKFPKNH